MSNGVGMNLSGLGGAVYFDATHPWLNMLKTAGAWGGATTVVLDENGYATTGTSGAVNTLFSINLNDAGNPNPQRVHIFHNGSAGCTVTLTLYGTRTIVSGAGSQHVVYDVALVDVSDVIMGVQITPPDGVLGSWPTSIEIVRDDQLLARAQGEFINPTYLADHMPWDVLRYMDWGATNSNQTTDSNERAKFNDCSWGLKGIPLEAMVGMSNRTNSDMWYNIPVKYTEASTTADCTYIRDNLNSGLRLHFEYSNETWNPPFDQMQYLFAYGQTDPTFLADWRAYLSSQDPTTDYSTAQGNERVAYGYRLVDHHLACKAVFAATPARVIYEFGVQTGYTLFDYYIVPGIRARGYEVSDVVGSGGGNLSATFYLNGGPQSTADATTNATLFAMADLYNAGNSTVKQAQIDRIFNSVRLGNDSGIPDPGVTLPVWKTYLTSMAAEAAQYGLKLSFYEGQFGHWNRNYVPTGNEDAEFVRVKPLFQAAMDDPQAGELLTEQLTYIRTLTDQAIVVYNNYGDYSKFGPWGTKDSAYSEPSTRWAAYQSFQESGEVTPTPSLGVPSARRLAMAWPG